MKPRVVLIDADNFAFAQYHAHAELWSETANMNTGLLHGTLMGLLHLARLFDHCPMICVWDGRGRNWRRAQAKFYKAQRVHKGNPVYEDCHRQMDLLMEWLAAIRLPTLRLDNMEADDTIGVLSKELQSDFSQIVIRSADKDFFQLADARVKIFRGGSSGQKITHANVEQYVLGESELQKLYGVPPRSWRHYRTLTGDPSDNIQGLKTGIGEVRAKAILSLGVRFPVESMPNTNSIRKKLPGIDLSEADWQRANRTFALTEILTNKTDMRIPLCSRERLQQFVDRQRSRGFSQGLWNAIEHLKLIQRLKRYDLDQVAMQALDLLRLCP